LWFCIIMGVESWMRVSVVTIDIGIAMPCDFV
jgi:hypothetical protein